MNYSVIFHVDELTKWDLTLKNVANLLEQPHQNAARVAVLANSEAVKGYLAQSALAGAMLKLNGRGVVFSACNNSLNALGIDRAGLPLWVRVVPAGVLELVERQAEGYAYIKP